MDNGFPKNRPPPKQECNAESSKIPAFGKSDSRLRGTKDLDRS
jgi:hypothetical protein